MVLKSIKNIKLAGKTVLVRVDFNVPLTPGKTPKIVDDTRIRLTIPTIEYLLKRNCKIILCSHLGRPEGKKDAKTSLMPVKIALEKLLQKTIYFSNLTSNTPKLISRHKQKDILLLENLRFTKQEEENSPKLNHKLKNLAQVYINDAFSVSHRPHASVIGVSRLLPAAAGLQFINEYHLLNQLISNPKRPLVTVVGGSKISTKAAAIAKLSQVSDVVLVGGGVANTFIKAEGIDIANSLLEKNTFLHKNKPTNSVSLAEKIISTTKTQKLLLNGYIPLPKILYPVDVIAATSINKPKKKQTITLTNGHTNGSNKSLMYLDIGPKTQRLFREIILQAETVFWNGPMGAYEHKAFETGTDRISHAVAKTSATTIVGGGDTLASIAHFGLQNRFDHISASGGAALEYLGNLTLPGLKPLTKT